MDLALNEQQQKAFYAVETECAVLGALILEPKAFNQIATLLKPEMFSKIAHQIIYANLHELYINHKPWDLVILTNYLRTKNELDKVGGALYLSTILERVAAAHHLEYHARILMDYSCKRLIYNEIVMLHSFVANPSNTLDSIMHKVSNLMEATVNKTFGNSRIRSMRELALEYMSNADKKNEQKYLTPYLTSFKDYIHAWDDGELIVVAGRPGMGKTAFVLHELYHQSKQGNPILFFTLEMKDSELFQRMLATETEINGERIIKYNLSSDDFEKIDDHLSVMENLPIYLNNEPHMTLDYIMTNARVYKMKYDIKAIAIDYLQLIELPNTETRALQIAYCTRKLKLLARSLELPIFLICQLNRETEQSSAKGIEPMLSHLRESGAIEQDADKVLFPIRLEYYYPNDPASFGKGYVKIAKNRKGKIGKPLVSISNDVMRWSSRS